jgi:hypothetical protein
MDNFFDLKKKELHLNLSKELIELNKQINSKQAELARDAIFLLSTLGPDAAFLLVYHLDDRNVDENVRASISFAIKTIIERSLETGNTKGVQQVTDLLFKRTDEVITSQIREGAPSIPRIQGHINALLDVSSITGCNKAFQAFGDAVAGYLADANELSSIIKEKDSLIEMLRDAKNKTACT